MPTTQAKPVYDARVNAPTTRDVSDRLALTARVRGGSMADHLTAALEKYLPSREQLADEVRTGARSDIAS